MTEQNKKPGHQQQGDDERRQAGQDRNQDRNQQKSDTQRRAEEAARKDKPKGGADSVGTVGT